MRSLWGRLRKKRSIGTERRRPRVRLRRRLLFVLLAVYLAPFALSLVYRVVPPPVTPLMIIRAIEGDGWTRSWVMLEEVPTAVPLAVMAGEDNRFCQHIGFDLVEMQKAIRDWREGGAIARPAKRAAVAGMVLSFVLAAAVGTPPLGLAVLAAVLGVSAIFVWSRPDRPTRRPPGE